MSLENFCLFKSLLGMSSLNKLEFHSYYDLYLTRMEVDTFQSKNERKGIILLYLFLLL